MNGQAAGLVPRERGSGEIRGEKNIRRVNRRLLAQAYGLIPRLAEDLSRLEALLRWAAGPVIAGIKPASLVRLDRDVWEKGGTGLCSSLGLSALPLREGAGGILVLLYRQGLLARKLRSGAAARYLRSLRYPAGTGLDGYLAFLQERFAGPGFPHEVGVFLGYPLEDVICFSAGKPSPYKCRGYWKVYHRPEKAERTFVYMDAARITLIRELFSGSLPEDDDRAFGYKGERRSPLSAFSQVLKGQRVTM
ncbi:MAG: DUF3793 family protein [Treponema sp.]|jgi:hypothetical protein|nr:DUF3793 family protein [Treponema sp.]